MAKAPNGKPKKPNPKTLNQTVKEHKPSKPSAAEDKSGKDQELLTSSEEAWGKRDLVIEEQKIDLNNVPSLASGKNAHPRYNKEHRYSSDHKPTYKQAVYNGYSRKKQYEPHGKYYSKYDNGYYDHSDAAAESSSMTSGNSNSKGNYSG